MHNLCVWLDAMNTILGNIEILSHPGMNGAMVVKPIHWIMCISAWISMLLRSCWMPTMWIKGAFTCWDGGGNTCFIKHFQGPPVTNPNIWDTPFTPLSLQHIIRALTLLKFVKWSFTFFFQGSPIFSSVFPTPTSFLWMLPWTQPKCFCYFHRRKNSCQRTNRPK